MNKDLFKIEELEPRLELSEWGEGEETDANGNCNGNENTVNGNCPTKNTSCNPAPKEEITKN